MTLFLHLLVGVSAVTKPVVETYKPINWREVVLETIDPPLLKPSSAAALAAPRQRLTSEDRPRPPPVEAIAAGVRALCIGGAYGYAGVAACFTALDLLSAAMRGGRRRPKKQLQLDRDCGSVAGMWLLDTELSDSLEPFLVAVGAPKLIAKLVGRKGKPVTISIELSTISIAVEGKPTETFSTSGTSTSVETPGGPVVATLQGDARRAFTITKIGPAQGEVVTETRELSADGNRLKCTFTHTRGDELDGVEVVRWYKRA